MILIIVIGELWGFSNLEIGSLWGSSTILFQRIYNLLFNDFVWVLIVQYLENALPVLENNLIE